MIHFKRYCLPRTLTLILAIAVILIMVRLVL